MRLNGKATGQIVQYSNKADSTNDGTTAVCDIAFDCDEELLASIVGEALAEVVFAACRREVVHSAGGDATADVWQIRDIHPSAKLVCELHRIRLGTEHTVNCQPKIRKFQPVEEARKVTMVLRIELGGAELATRRFLDEKMGSTIGCAFEPATMNLPGID